MSRDYTMLQETDAASMDVYRSLVQSGLGFTIDGMVLVLWNTDESCTLQVADDVHRFGARLRLSCGIDNRWPDRCEALFLQSVFEVWRKYPGTSIVYDTADDTRPLLARVGSSVWVDPVHDFNWHITGADLDCSGFGLFDMQLSMKIDWKVAPLTDEKFFELKGSDA